MRKYSTPMLVLLAIWSSALSAQTKVFPEIAGWSLSVDSIVYSPNNLWDVIDGAADLFLEYNFVDLHIGRYQKPGDLEVKVELYKHKSAVDAFGMYSQERYPDYHFINLGTQGYAEKGSLNLLSGEYYVKLSTVQGSPDMQEALHVIAERVVAHLNRTSAWPSVLTSFPLRGKEPNSEQYVSRNFLGYSFFNGAFTASYKSDGSFKAFVMQCATGEDAAHVVENYLKELPKGNVSKKEGGRYEVDDPHNGRVVFLLYEHIICGVYGSDLPKNPADFLNEFIGKLADVH
jgi:hypothetical protein